MTLTASETGVRIYGRNGLGDNIYMRPIVRVCSERRPTWVETPWPELFSDLPVQCTKPVTSLRTQLKNMERREDAFVDVPQGLTDVLVKYSWRDLTYWSLFVAMTKNVPFRVKPVLDLPDFGPSPIQSDKPIALIRPVTERAEWLNAARNPLPEYVAQAAALLRERGYFTVVVADTEPDKEWLVGEAPLADASYLKGEFNVTQLLALAKNAAVVVGGVGWIVPAAIAHGTPTVIICGGQGGHNAPAKIVGPLNDSSIGWVKPDAYCKCANMLHQCKKTITGFAGKFESALAKALRGSRI